MNVYCDGGLIGANPSPNGGTWCFVVVDDDVQVAMQSGIVTPAEAGLPAITNNYTELLAAVNALEMMDDGWTGTLFTDSNVTRLRLISSKPKMAGIPPALQQRLRDAKRRVGAFKVALLDGHPTRQQLASGIGKRGGPVSKWNVLCDEECTRLANEFKARRAA